MNTLPIGQIIVLAIIVGIPIGWFLRCAYIRRRDFKTLCTPQKRNVRDFSEALE